MTRGTPQEIVERGLAAARRRDCAIVVTETSTVNLRWALDGLTTNGVTTVREVTAVVADPRGTGAGLGVRSRQGIGVADVEELVAEAAAAAAAAEPAEDAAPFLSGEALPGWDDPAGGTGAASLAPVAVALGEVLGRSRAEGRESFGFALHEVTTTWTGTGTGTGLRYRHEQPRGTVELTGKADGRTRSTWCGRATRDFADVDMVALDDEVRRRLDWQRRTVPLAPGRHDTVLPPSAVADLLIPYLWAADARAAHEGRSALSRPGGGTRLGDRLTAARLTLLGDPAWPGLECSDRVVATQSSAEASVFDIGMPVPRTTWIEDGTVAALPAGRHTAALTGLPVHPPAGNLVLTGPGDRRGGGPGDGPDRVSLDDLVAGLERGVLLTCLWYIRDVDPMTLLLTGLTRDGVYVVEGGEVVGATTNFRFNVSPLDVLAAVRAAGSTEITLAREWGEWFTRTAMPPLHVGGFNFSTVSEAS